MYNMTQLIEEPTHFTEETCTLLDVIIVSDSNILEKAFVGDCFLDQNVRYHCPVYASLTLCNLTSHSFKREIWLFNQGDYVSYRNSLNSIDWEELLSDSDIDTNVKRFNETIIKHARNNIPNKIVTIRKSDPPWMNNEIRTLIRRRKRLHSIAKRTDHPDKWTEFRKTRNHCIRTVRNARDDYYKKLSKNISECNDSRNGGIW